MSAERRVKTYFDSPLFCFTPWISSVGIIIIHTFIKGNWNLCGALNKKATAFSLCIYFILRDWFSLLLIIQFAISVCGCCFRQNKSVHVMHHYRVSQKFKIIIILSNSYATLSQPSVSKKTTRIIIPCLRKPLNSAIKIDKRQSEFFSLSHFSWICNRVTVECK